MITQRKLFIALGGMILLFVLSTFVFVPTLFKTGYSAEVAKPSDNPALPLEMHIMHLKTPEPLKAIYMTACVAATPSWRTKLKNMVEETELNSVVIDIKDSTGTVAFPLIIEGNERQSNIGRGCVAPDLQEYINELHASGIYVIGRISVFQDPAYTVLHPELAVKSVTTGDVWKDKKGLSFVDVGAKPYWDYIVAISKASYEIGFDELNYDYVRYPSDGDMKDANYTWLVGTSTKAETLEGFFIHLSKSMGYPSANPDTTRPILSVDLFGMTTTVENDMGIGQVLERALQHFDYVSPMVYPSHYPNSWHGFANPAEYPYDVVHIAMSEGKRREEIQRISLGLATSTRSKLRPWLQDFNLGATYGPDKVQAQIQATYDSGLDSWLLWNAGNIYTKEALQLQN